jgi:hypothetical protein
VKRLLMLAAGIEVGTGLFLIVAPSLFTQLIFAGPLTAPGQALAPLAGFGLLALALACWPSSAAGWSGLQALRAFLLFSVLCAIYLIFRGVTGGTQIGILLWPAAGLHAVLALLLGWSLFKASKQSVTGG